MVSITVRALILGLAFGICIAMKMPADSKCKMEGGEQVLSELKQNYTECLNEVKPGADPKMAHEDKNALSETDWKRVGYCMNVRKGTISEDGVYNIDVAMAGVDSMTGTDEAVKAELKEKMAKCPEGKDAKEDCEQIMDCVHSVVSEVCGFPKRSDKEE